MEDPKSLGRSNLEEAIRRYEHTYYDAFEEASDKIFYSARYRRKIHALLRQNTRPSALFGKRTVALLLAAVLLCAGIFSVSAVTHEKTKIWLENVYARFTEIVFSEKDASYAPDRIQTLYMPTYIPEDFIFTDQYRSQTKAKTLWTNDDGAQIFFLQTTLDSKTTVDHENAKYEIREMSDRKLFILQKKGQRCYYWTDENYAYSLIVSDTLSDDICIFIIQSVSNDH